MLQNKFEMPLGLVVKDSKILRFYLYLIIFLSFLSVLISALVLSVKIVLCVALLCLSLLYFKKQSINKITFLKLSSDNQWELETGNGQSFDVELKGECIVTYFIVWLNFTTCTSLGRKKQFHILLLPDSVEKDLLRRLRVRLRFLYKQNNDQSDLALPILCTEQSPSLRSRDKGIL